MSQNYYYRQVQFGPGGISPAVKGLIIANVSIFLLQSIGASFMGISRTVIDIFGMTPHKFLFSFHFWQPVSYMFLHQGLSHIFFNMLMLWMFGTEVENRMGTKRFLVFYFFCGICAGISTCIMITNWNVPTIGASGALFGVLLAYGLMFPDRMILLFFVIPIKAYYFVLGITAVNLYMLVFMQNGGISYIAHVSGALFGYVFLRYNGIAASMFSEYKDKKMDYKDQLNIAEEAANRRKVDELLDKINKQGLQSLSGAERKFLRERSKRRRE